MDLQELDGHSVAEVMTYRPPCLGLESSLAEAETTLARTGADCVPVTDDGMLVGVVTGADLLRALATPAGVRTGVRHVLSETPACVCPDTPLTHALELLVATGCRTLPVTIGALLIGMVSRADVLQMLDADRRPVTVASSAGGAHW